VAVIVRLISHRKDISVILHCCIRDHETDSPALVSVVSHSPRRDIGPVGRNDGRIAVYYYSWSANSKYRKSSLPCVRNKYINLVDSTCRPLVRNSPQNSKHRGISLVNVKVCQRTNREHALFPSIPRRDTSQFLLAFAIQCPCAAEETKRSRSSSDFFFPGSSLDELDRASPFRDQGFSTS